MKFFNLHTHHFTNQPDVLELVNQYPQELVASIPFYSIGIHPLFIDDNQLESDFRILEEKLALPECLALGECGWIKEVKLRLKYNNWFSKSNWFWPKKIKNQS